MSSRTVGIHSEGVYEKKKPVRLVVLSDTHGRHDELTSLLPTGNILLHCGDFADKGSTKDALSFIQWISSLTQYPEKLVIDGNHDRTLPTEALNDEDVDDREKINLSKLFAAADPTVKLLQDETFISQDGLIVHGSSWSTCETDSYLTQPPPNNADVWMVHANPHVTPGHALPQRMLDLHPHFWQGWKGSRCITGLVRDRAIPLCLSGHVHHARGVLQWKQQQERDGQEAIPTFVNAANIWRWKDGSGVSPPIVIDFDVISKKVVLVQNEPHPTGS